MDLLTCITDGMTWFRLTVIVLVFAPIFIPYDVWTNRKAERNARQKEGAQMLDNFELIQMVRAKKED